MKRGLVIGIIVVIIVILMGIFIQQTQTPDTTSITDNQINTCEGLVNNFDVQIDSNRHTECDKWVMEKKPKPILVGGKLIEISKTDGEAYERNEFMLTFKGFQKQGKIYIGTKNESVPYEIGKFYKFDLGNECKLIYSMASSGMFSDPNLDALEHLPECD